MFEKICSLCCPKNSTSFFVNSKMYEFLKATTVLFESSSLRKFSWPKNSFSRKINDSVLSFRFLITFISPHITKNKDETTSPSRKRISPSFIAKKFPFMSSTIRLSTSTLANNLFCFNVLKSTLSILYNVCFNFTLNLNSKM